MIPDGPVVPKDFAVRPAAAEDREVLACGDWNITPTEADIRNSRATVKNPGFLPHERAWPAGLFDAGRVDVVRGPGTVVYA